MDITALSTEQMILDAAKQVFTTHGFSGANMQKIADLAGINRALVHYYFRNKQKLFDRVFEETLKTVMTPLLSTLEKPLPLLMKIETFINSYIDVLKENPCLPVFMLHELSANKPLVIKFFETGVKGRVCHLMKELLANSSLASGPSDIRQVIVNFVSMLVFPFVGMDLFRELFTMTSAEYNDFLEKRKKLLYKMVVSQLKT